MEVISSIYNSGCNIKKFYLGSRELNLAYLGNQVIYDEVIGDNDLNYILYEFYGSDTLPNTVEAPVKSAILKGQTLVNLVTQKSGSFNGTRFLRIPLSRTLKTNTKYFVKFNLRESSLTNGVACRLRIDTSGSVVGNLISDGIITVTGDGYNYIEFYIRNADDVTNRLDAVVDDIMLIEYQEGMENLDIPYFEGMQSVKMPVLTTTGKNLLEYIEWEIGKRLLTNGAVGESIGNNVTDYINVSNLDIITFSGFSKSSHCLYDKDKNIIGERALTSKMTVDVSGADYIRVTIDNTKDYSNPQMEVGSVATSYEPFKSNILTVNEDVELRGIGDVKDELNLLTGEISNNFNKITIDGTENWYKSSNETELTVRYRCNNIGVSILKENMCICDSYNVGGNTTGDNLVVAFGGTTLTYRVLKSKFPTLEDFKKWLNDNPHTFIYQTEKSIKTVDLTIVDQDGKTINKLNSFNGTTHVSTEVAENSAYPMVSLEVASELQAAMSKVAEDIELIKPVQNDIETTLDTQSNDIDSLLLATTELFEMFL